MAKTHSDGVFTRKDRPGFWISWFDAQGRRRYRKTNAQSLTQARAARAGELVRVEQARLLGFLPPGNHLLLQDDDGRDIRFLKHDAIPLGYSDKHSAQVNAHFF